MKLVIFLLYNNLFIYQVLCTLIYRRRSLYSFLLSFLSNAYDCISHQKRLFAFLISPIHISWWNRWRWPHGSPDSKLSSLQCMNWYWEDKWASGGQISSPQWEFLYVYWHDPCVGMTIFTSYVISPRGYHKKDHLEVWSLYQAEAWTKWPLFCRRHIQIYFLQWKCMNFD